ncbi:sugar ABC transporter substrate-binding protein [Lichenibacterium minor]|uniref:Sugar ABC transporter substrate-binding protein n=1 Tax=Lichenibacterium minor TaxID=2316528 RepID=A0A4Q2U3G2_9HYPH|nr:sugar ABC transporter substrate-binding protein [Lichenibacterium minor]RYC29265.1 sugar ABC transporter substrate-binding protein [Lichenibacterium minor]
MRVKALAIGVACAVALCGPASATTIGASISHFDENFLTLIIGAMKAEAQRTGTTIAFEDAAGDTDRQISQVQNFVSQHVDAIVVNAVDSSATRKMTEAATAAHIPLVYVNRGPDGAALPAGVSFVSSDEHVSGRLQGEALAKLLGGKGNVVIMEGELSDQATRLRTEGVVKVAAEHPGMKVIAVQPADYSRSKAIDLMNNWLSTGDHIDAVAANNDEMAIGAILALQGARVDPRSVVVAGVDATPDGLAEMAKGRLAVTVFQDAKSQGRVAVDTALRMARGETVPNHVDVPFELVTPDNMNSYVGR